MQIPADPLDAAALDAALQPGQDRSFVHLLEVDWNRDGLYSHALSDLSAAVSVQTGVQVTRELSDSAPGSERIVSGASAAQLTAVLDGALTYSGTDWLAAELLAPYNSASPLYGVKVMGTPVRWSVITVTDRGPIPVKQFTGYIDQRQVDRATNTVTLTCLDAVVLLSGAAFWPPWAVDGGAAGNISTTKPQRGLASSVVDMLCNANGLLTRPRPPWAANAAVIALVWLPLNGSFAPSVGRCYSIAPWGNSQIFPELYNQSPAPTDVYWTTGPFGLARNANPTVYPGSLIYTPRDSMPIWAGRSTSITAWVLCGPGSAGYDPTPAATRKPPLAQVHYGYSIASGNYYAFRLTLASNGTTLQIQVETGTNLLYRANYVPGTDAWRHVHVQLDHSNGPVRAKLIVDGVTQQNFVPTGAGNSEAAPTLDNLFLPAEGVRIHPGVDMCDVIAWQETGAPTVVPERTFTAGATVDPGLNEISYLPAPSGSPWDAIKAISEAEYAAVLVDENGLLHWWNRQTVRSNTPAYTLDLTDATDIGSTDTAAGTANAAQVATQAGIGTWKAAFEPSSVDQLPIPAGASTWVVPVAPEVLVPETGTVPRLFQTAASANTAPVWTSKVDSGWVFVYDGGQTQELVNQNLVNTSDQTGLADRQLLRIVVNNTGATSGRFRLQQDPAAGTDPQVALRIAGLVLVQDASVTSNVTSAANIAADGRTTQLDLGSGEWRQDADSQTAAALFALRRSTQAIPVFDAITTPGDPRRQLTDPCLLLLGSTAARVVAYTAGITRTLTAEGLVDQLTVRATHAPGRWALGDPVLGQLGTARLG